MIQRSRAYISSRPFPNETLLSMAVLKSASEVTLSELTIMGRDMSRNLRRSLLGAKRFGLLLQRVMTSRRSADLDTSLDHLSVYLPDLCRERWHQHERGEGPVRSGKEAKVKNSLAPCLASGGGAMKR